MESLYCRPFGSMVQQTAFSLFQLLIMTHKHRWWMPGSPLVRPETLCFPSVCSVGKMPLKIGAGTGEGIYADVPLCHNQTWFSTRLTTMFLSVFKDHNKSNGRDIPIDRAKQPVPQHLQSFRTSI